MSSAVSEVQVLIVGSGFSGIGMAVLLREAGITSFEILEKANDVGGTWRENTYPGAACDVPSHLYSFSFEPNPRWSHAFSPQAEILEYLRYCARKYDILRHVRFGAHVEQAVFDETNSTWDVRVRDGRRFRAKALVLGNGALHIPSLPNIAGRDTFAGRSFHSAQWDHSYDFRGKRLAVVGTGASAIQFAPAIASSVAKLHLFQRTAPWIVPRRDREFSPSERAVLKSFKLAHRAYRASIYWRLELAALGFVMNPELLKIVERIGRRHLADQVSDARLRQQLTPTFRAGCKRILISNDYYPMFARPNVELVTDRIESIEPRGVRTADGKLREVDALIYGTGFSIADYVTPLHIRGLGGRELNDVWRDAAEAYLGITVAGFPNLFMMMGPNTGLGHNSMIFMIEAQARYAVQAIQLLLDRSLARIEPRQSVQDAFNLEIQQRLKKTVWASGCSSWYLGAPDGRNATLWPASTVEYWQRTRRLREDDFVLTA